MEKNKNRDNKEKIKEQIDREIKQESEKNPGHDQVDKNFEQKINKEIDSDINKAALIVQRNEITEYYVYTQLSKICKNPHNAEVLRTMGEEELGHSEYWKKITGVDIKPDNFKVFRNVIKAKVFGLTFTLKQMEKGEKNAQKAYATLIAYYPEAQKIKDEEEAHEKELLNMLDEELLQHVGSIVLGLNDALVELTGVLAGFTLALGETKLISLTGLVTGVAAALSMASSNYLSNRAENNPRAVKSAIYTGMAYLITVALLVLPYLLLTNPFVALAITITTVVIIIYLFNYYLATAKDLNFIRHFLEMALISLGVAALSFGIGYILKRLLDV